MLATYFDVFFGPPSEEEEDDGDRPFSSLGARLLWSRVALCSSLERSSHSPVSVSILLLLHRRTHIQTQGRRRSATRRR